MSIRLLLIFFALLSFSGCNKKDKELMYEPTSSVITKKVYKIGIHPYLNSKKMYTSYRPILDLLEDKLGDVELILETSKDYAAYNVKLYRGDFHFSLPNPFQTYNALSKNYHVIAKMKPDSVFKGIFVARKDANIKNFSQLKGSSLSFPAPTALAATMMPLYFLYENGVDVKNDIKKKYVGSQYSSILNAYSRDTLVGATWPPPWKAWCKENPEKAKEMHIVWQTQPLINNGFIVRNDVDEKLSTSIAKTLVELSTHTKGQKLLYEAGFEGFEYANNDSYMIVKSFLKKYDHAIGIPK